jgi:hypothetical protein
MSPDWPAIELVCPAKAPDRPQVPAGQAGHGRFKPLEQAGHVAGLAGN